MHDSLQEVSFETLLETAATLTVVDAAAPQATVSDDYTVPAGSTVILFASPDDLNAVRGFLPADVIAAGFQRPNEWRDPKTRAAVSQLKKLMTAAAFVIAFSGSATASVYAEAHALGQHLARIRPVTYQRGGFATFADDIEAVPELHRAAYISGLIAQAAKTLGARPKDQSATERQKSEVAVVNVKDGKISYPARTSDETGFTFTTPERILLDAAAERIGEVTVWDDLADPGRAHIEIRHDLMVYIDGEDGIVRGYPVDGLENRQLENPRSYLDRVPNGPSVMAEPGNLTAIEKAIRRSWAEDAIKRLALRRTGWFRNMDTGRWGYVSPSGILTADGLHPDVTSLLEQMHEAFRLADVSNLTPGEEKAAADAAIATLAELGTHAAVLGLMGATIYGLGGLSGLKRGAGSVPTFLGSPGSGKSYIIRRFLSCFLAPNAVGPTLRSHDSGAILRNAYRGMDSSVIVADDFKAMPFDTRMDSEYQKFNAVVRPGYEGGAGGGAKAAGDGGSWSYETSNPSSPIMIVGAESLPVGAMAAIKSTIERLFVVEITQENVFRSGNRHDWDNATKHEGNRIHIAAFVRWVARKLDAAETVDAWRAPWLKLEAAEQERLMKLAPHITPRVAESHAMPLIGAALWTQYLLEIGAMTVDEREKFLVKSRDTVSSLAKKHARLISGDGDTHDLILDALRAGIVAGKLFIGVSDPEKWEQRIGLPRKVVDSAGHDHDCILLLPDQALDFLRRDERFRTMTRNQLARDLRPVLLTTDGENGSATRQLSIDGQQVRVLAIPTTLWGLAAEE